MSFAKQLFPLLFLLSFGLRAMEPVDSILANPAVQRALEIDLLAANMPPCDESYDLIGRAGDRGLEANYDESLKIMLTALEKFPHDFFVQAYFATLLGDHADNFSSAIKEKMVKRSTEIFTKLKGEFLEQPKRVEFFFRNEYCWRFGDYKAQYELGLERVSYYWGSPEWKTRGFRGYYSQGVGAAHYSQELLKAGNKEQALEYAQKAVIAWAQYFSYENTYYNSYVHYALALGILGHKDKMIEALTRAADLIKRDLSYHEFKEVIDFVNGLESH
jgi:tetratricopeptide (TPR) repeat protein